MSILKCEVCQGTGVVPGKVCGMCHGAGIAVIDERQALYFGARIDRATITAERVSKIVRAGFAGVAAAVGILGLVALIVEAWPNIAVIFTGAYWLTASRGKLWFSFTLLLDLYLVMRLVCAGEQAAKIVKEPRTPLKAVPETWKAFAMLSKARRIDVAPALSDDLRARLKEAWMLTAGVKHAEVGLGHFLAGLLSSVSLTSLLARLEIEPKGFHDRLLNFLQESRPGQMDPVISQEVKQILIAAYLDGQRVQSARVTTHHVLLEIVLASERLQEIFFDLGVDLQKLRNAVRWLEINDEIRRRWGVFSRAARSRPKGAMNRAMTALQTRVLDRFSDDLTLLAGRGYLELTVDRAQVFDEVFRIFEGERKSVLLVGSHGVGKEAIVQGIAQRMVEEQVPKLLRDRRLASLSIPKLMAGVTLSEAEERLLGCLSDVGRARNVVLAIPNVHEAFAGSGAGGLDLGEVLSSELAKGYFLAIATTTPEEYRARIENTALDHACVKVEIPEPDVNASIHILESKVGPIEYREKVYFSYHALEQAVLLSTRYIKDRALPEKAIDIVKEAGQYARSRRGEKALVRAEDVAEIISQKTHVPVTAITAKEADKLLNLEKIMHERIVGQDEAVRAVSSALRRARAELREAKRPIANFLFLGPTGVGKTETAKTVAEVYFGNEKTMVRIDMSEYQDKASVYRLLGAPGEGGGLLTEPVRKNTFSLILLDEIEKAHPDILNVFLQVMDDGRATDSAGRVIDFTNTIIIATSNAERSYFKPEFLNRCDAVIEYKSLTAVEILQIAKLMMGAVAKQLEQKGIAFRATDEAVAELAAAGFDPQFGARPLRRVIQEKVQDALANLLLTQKLDRRDVVVLEKGGVLRVEKAEKL